MDFGWNLVWAVVMLFFAWRMWPVAKHWMETVSYTHLTLPTIYSV